jgi:diguanylate cyclase (GGDEF)-like protein
MVGQKTPGTYADNFAYEATTLRERAVAGSLAAGVPLCLGLLGIFGRNPGPAFIGLIPFFESVVITASVFTAWLLFAQFRIRRYAPLAVLATAYAMYGAFHAAFLLTFPGAVAPAGLLGGGLQTAPWLMELARIGFAGGVIAFVLVERSKGRTARWHAGLAARAGAWSLAYVVLGVLVAVAFHGALPVVVLPSGVFTAGYSYAIAPLTGLSMFVVALVIVIECGVTRRVHLWLAVVLLAMGLEIFAGAVFGEARYTMRWYVAHADFAFSSMLFFAVMQVQLTSFLRRAARNGERAIALHDIVSLGSDSHDDRNVAMLERAAIDLNFDWACLVRIADGWVTLEGSVGDSPFRPGFAAPAGAAWLREAPKGRELAIHKRDDEPQWVDTAPSMFHGWTPHVSVPVFVDDELYGVLGFGNESRRKIPLNEGDLSFLRLLGSLAGVTIERARQRRLLSTLAYSDALTGLPNRASLFKKLEAEIERSQTSRRQFALHYLDLNGFKSVNDLHGHAAGDEVLREVAQRLRGVVRESDTVARLGGDEFVVIQTPVEDAHAPGRFATRLRGIFESPIAHGGASSSIGCSVGTSRYPQDGKGVDALLDHADASLYRFKARIRRPVHADLSLAEDGGT